MIRWLLLGSFVAFCGSSPVHASDALNAIIGDASWIWAHGSPPGDVPEEERIRVHLAFVESALRGADVAHLSRSQRERRSVALGTLQTYRAIGEFPRRTVDSYSGRRPRFIDDRGVHCAVGYMIAATGHPELARRIRDRWEYAYVPEIEEPELMAWAERHGFTIRELATIQPGYDAPPTSRSTRDEIERRKDAITLECAREHEPVSSFRLRVRGDSHGNAHVRARSDDPFVRCFIEKLGNLGAGGAWDQEPTRYRLRLRVRITSPQELLEHRLAALQVRGNRTRCIPRPGVVPDQAFFNVRVDARGVRVGVRTEPRNAEVESCLQEWLRQQLAAFGPGRWSLHGRAPNLPLERVVSSEQLQQALETNVGQLATECHEHGAPERATVRARVEPDEPFTIDVEGGEPAWRDCLEASLQQRLQRNFEVSRQLPNGSYERFFRADASASGEVSFEVEAPEDRERRVEEERRRMEEEIDVHF